MTPGERLSYRQRVGFTAHLCSTGPRDLLLALLSPLVCLAFFGCGQPPSEEVKTRIDEASSKSNGGELQSQPEAKASLSQGDAQRGEEIFEKATCATCHPAGTNNVEPDKPLKRQDFLKRFPDRASLATRIREGGKLMPPFDTQQISDAEMADLIAYIYKLNNLEVTSN